MPHRSIPVLAALLCILHSSPLTPAADWPQWRGPNNDGTSPETGLPLEWSKDKNVAWRLPLPGPAGSTPCVWGDRIFLTSAVNGAEDIVLLAVSRDGKELWRQRLGGGNRNVRGDEGNLAAPSPSTDGKHVWTFTGKGDLACHDLEGKQIWSANLQERHGRYQIQFGMTSTPVLHDGVLYVLCVHSGEPYLLAIDAATGKDRWKHMRKTDARDECEHSYASPILYQDAERKLILAHGGDYLTAHALDGGREVWRVGALNPKEGYNPTLRFVASPAAVPGLVIVPSAKSGPVHAIKPDGAGDVTTSHRLWGRARETPDVPTPAIHGGLVYLLRENGDLICHDAKTGEELYQKRTHRDRHRASPVVADGKVYCAAADGTVTVVQAGREFKVLATNTLDEHLSSTPVPAGGRLYLRTYAALYAVEAPRQPRQ
jgi:outer membrane protein assembly factor BamB